MLNLFKKHGSTAGLCAAAALVLLISKKVLCNYIKDVSLRIIKFLVKRELLINMFSYSQTSMFYVKGNFKLDSVKA